MVFDIDNGILCHMLSVFVASLIIHCQLFVSVVQGDRQWGCCSVKTCFGALFTRLLSASM